MTRELKKYICKGPNKHHEQLIFCVDSKLMCKQDIRDNFHMQKALSQFFTEFSELTQVMK